MQSMQLSDDTEYFALGVFCVETEKKKIALIGPVYPYKGGIAHNTSLLYRTLSKKYDVELISYKMQYPKLLFKKEQKDFKSDLFKVDEAQFLLNTANPFNIINVALRIKKHKPDLVILQWWHPYFAPCYEILGKVLGRRMPKLFICHNVFPHERFPLDRFLTKRVLKMGNYFIVHSQSDGEELMQVMPDAVYARNPIPIFNVFRQRNITKEQARVELQKKQDAKQMLFFGFVREYKGLKYLLMALPKIREYLQDINLMVVGAFADDKEEYLHLIRELRIDDCVELIDKYVSDNEVEKYFAASDIVVLPYISATQSGIVQIAYGFEKPVIVTNVGGLPDVVQDGKTGYIVEAGRPEQIADAVIDFYSQNREAEMCGHVRKEAYQFDWERMREKIEELIGW